MKKKTNSQSAFFNSRILLSFVFCSIGVFLAMLASGAFSNTFAQSKNSAPDAAGPVSGETEQLSPADNNGRYVQMIEFVEPGIMRRYVRPPNERFRADTPQARVALDQVKTEHIVHIQAIANAIGRQPEVTHYFTVTHSGIATRLTPEEAQIVRMMPGVKSIERERLYTLDTFRSPFFIGADKIWDGTASGGVATKGQGIVIADLDTGLVAGHPSFANDASCGHGVGGAPDKLLSLLDCASTDPSGQCNGPSPTDTNGHGSHTASTAGGNVVPTSASPAPNAQIQGVAPCANIRMYKVCATDTCGQADIQAGMTGVLLHGDVDVMNFSISGGNTPWQDNDLRKLDLVDAGVVVSASAGNTSASIPNPVGQVAHLGPWIQTVAASTKDTTGNPAAGDILASFSLRGPTSGQYENLTKPDVTGPGVNIYAALLSNYGSLSGTSMSCPHLTGGSALVRAVHPTWLPPEVKSALMMTSFNGGHKENGTTPWDPDDVGTGRIDLTKATLAGLVMHETFANFTAANPAIGGDPRTLNIPSVRDVHCNVTCTWTRTVRNTKTVPTSWTAVGTATTAGSFSVVVSPPAFAFTGNLAETQVLTITATPLVDLTAAVSFGQVLLHEAAAVSPDERLTVAIKGLPVGLATPTPTPPPASPTPSVPPTPTPTISPTPIPTPSPEPTATPTPSTTPRAQAVNLSTRMRVETGDRVGIGGFIVQGSTSKTLLLRAIGPSLVGFGVPAAEVLADPIMELHGPGAFATVTNNNWRDTQETEIQATGIPPTNDLESAILVTLPPGSYTAIVRGNGATAAARSGVSLVEVYDLDPVANRPTGDSTPSKLGNLSTRAFSGVGSNVIIVGFILGNNGGDDNVIIRGLGPSLASQGVPSPLADPTLELRNSDGTLLVSDNDWQDNPAQAAIVTSAGLAPSNDLEAAIAATLPPGAYTALLAGLNNGTGIGLVEVYDRGDGSGGAPIPTPTPGITPEPSPSPSPGVPTPTPSAPPASPTPPAASPTPSPTTCTENFDGVTPPALPPGWTQTIVAGPPPGWVTSTASPDAGPNDAFIIDTAVVSDKVLDRAGVVISSSAPVLSFRNNFNTEFSDGTYFDGGVLEVASPNINGGAFTDVIDPLVGGSFVSGEYTGTIDTTAGSPIAGRDAWSGNSGGYIDSVINLGPNLNGQTVTFRWRMGTDEASAETGWRVDSVVITGASCP